MICRLLMVLLFTSAFSVAILYFWRGNLKERDHLGDLGVDGTIILRRIFRKWDVGYGLDRSGSG